MSTQKLLSKYVDKPIALDRVVGDKTQTLEGTLLSSIDGLILRGKDGQIHSIREYGYSGLRFSELPGGLITRPTLIWDVAAKKGGTHDTRLLVRLDLVDGPLGIPPRPVRLHLVGMHEGELRLGEEGAAAEAVADGVAGGAGLAFGGAGAVGAGAVPARGGGLGG